MITRKLLIGGELARRWPPKRRRAASKLRWQLMQNRKFPRERGKNPLRQTNVHQIAQSAAQPIIAPPRPPLGATRTNDRPRRTEPHGPSRPAGSTTGTTSERDASKTKNSNDARSDPSVGSAARTGGSSSSARSAAYDNAVRIITTVHTKQARTDASISVCYCNSP